MDVDHEFFYEDNETNGEVSSGEEDYLYDTYDDIITEDDIENERIESESGITSQQLGTVLALADDIAAEKKAFAAADRMAEEYDLDYKTDEDNYKLALAYEKVNKHGELPLFDQIIHDICKGKRSLFDTNYYK